MISMEVVGRNSSNNISVMRVGFDSLLNDNVVVVDNLELALHGLILPNIAVPEIGF